MKRIRVHGLLVAWLLVAAGGAAVSPPAIADEPTKPVSVFASGDDCPVQIGNNGSLTGAITSQGEIALGNATRVDGALHAEGDLTVGNNSKHNGIGTVTHVGEAKLGANTSTWVPIKVGTRAPLDPPTMPDLIDPADGVIEHRHAGDWTVKNGVTLKDGVHRVDGNVVLGNNIRGRVTIVATGTITIGNNASLTGYHEGLSLVSRASTGCTPAITIGNNATLGIIHAPMGAIKTHNGVRLDAAVATGFVTGNNTSVTGHNFPTAGEVVAQPVETRVARGSLGSLQGPDGFTNLVITGATPTVAGVSWQGGDTLTVAVDMSTAEGRSSVALSGTGCTVNGCDQPWSLLAELTVTGIQAPHNVVLDEVPVPSPDRAAAAHDVGGGAAVMGDEVTIVLKDPAGGRAVADAVAGSVDAVVAGGLQDLGIFLLRWDTAQDIQARLDQIIADTRVASVEGNLLASVDTAENVPGYSDETKYGDGDRWHLDMIHAPDAWKKATGKNEKDERVKLGIIEHRRVSNHPDLPGRSYEAGAPSELDERDHVNHVAGLACAKDNGKGVIGVAHECDLLSSTVGTWTYTGTPGVENVRTYLPAWDENLAKLIKSGARVINASFGATLYCYAIEEEGEPACNDDHLSSYLKGYSKDAGDWSKGGTNAFSTVMKSAPNTLLVISAGNYGMPISTNPWSVYAQSHNVPNVLTVASVDANAKLSYFSNFAADIAAPGGFKTNRDTVHYDTHAAIISTVQKDTNDGYGRMTGTSMAAPLVSGTAALVAQLHPDWTGRQLAMCLIDSSTRDVTERNDKEPAWLKDGHRFTYSGSIPLLDAAAAVDCADGNDGDPTDPKPSAVPRLLSRSIDGVPGNSGSWPSAVSADGRWVTYVSTASNLVEGDTINDQEVFLWDRDTGATQRVSVASDGTQDYYWSDTPAISADGRWVTYVTGSSGLAQGAPTDDIEVFLWDRDTGTTQRVSVASDGTQTNHQSHSPAISADGRWVTFRSGASNLVEGDTNNAWDVFLWDRDTGTTQRVSVASDGTQGNHDSMSPAISGDGRWVTYYSLASNLVSGDPNMRPDIPAVFVWDRDTGVTRRISSDLDAKPHLPPAISANGRWIAYTVHFDEEDDGSDELEVRVWDRDTGTTRRIASNTDDIRPHIDRPAMSADGRWVTVTRSALVPWLSDMLVWDRDTGVLTPLAVVTTDGNPPNGNSVATAISADGRWIGYYSYASNLVSDDTTRHFQAFLSPNPALVD